MRVGQNILRMVLLAGAAGSVAAASFTTMKIGDGSTFALLPFGAVLKTGIWHQAGWTPTSEKPINVCWERLGDSSEVSRLAVQRAIEKTWSHYAMVSFPKAWGGCQEGEKGIRIGVSVSQSGTDGLGQHLDGKKNGMLLMMDYPHQGICKDRVMFCVTATATHEFGHALGMAHEQNRDDAEKMMPGCGAKHSGDLPDWKVTKFDPQSIMNYCNKDWNNNGELSGADIETVTRLYGARA